MTSLFAHIASHGATPAKWLMVLGMAYTLASVVLVVAAPPEAAPAQPRGTVARDPGGTRPGADLQSILNANLFGAPGAVSAATARAAAVRETPVDTRLPLTLHGVFVADPPQDSTAILAHQGRAENLYRIGEAVPGNATLEAVALDHVLLRRGRSPGEVGVSRTGPAAGDAERPGRERCRQCAGYPSVAGSSRRAERLPAGTAQRPRAAAPTSAIAPVRWRKSTANSSRTIRRAPWANSASRR